ncbi:hypothetical protein HXX76_005504 [Chlamydomonas incerta]|uniref:Uncharacterized protein n=1 Tax=Chlamydomonas incerta TaxID=51695 RepID=A0A835T2R6_CHLIN|nr:hypothetical protein HXX76_005504 [Chlamydomonas incerta]|eukprot:KAG2437887.1 hypothetical protein HXX76_005504 [Chlamydomonas incerta]
MAPKRKAAAASAQNAAATKKTRQNAPAVEPRPAIVIGERIASSVAGVVAGASVSPASLAESLNTASKRVSVPGEPATAREAENGARVVANALRSLLCWQQAVPGALAGAFAGMETVGGAVAAVGPACGGGDVDVVEAVGQNAYGSTPVDRTAEAGGLVTPDTPSGPVTIASAPEPSPSNLHVAVRCSQNAEPSCATPAWSPEPATPNSGAGDDSDGTSSWLSEVLEGSSAGPSTPSSSACGPKPAGGFGSSIDGVTAGDVNMGCPALVEQQAQLRASLDAAAAALSPSHQKLISQPCPAAATAPANGGNAFAFPQDVAKTHPSPATTLPTCGSIPPNICFRGTFSEPSAAGAAGTTTSPGGSCSAGGCIAAVSPASQLQPDLATVTSTSSHLQGARGDEQDSACGPQRRLITTTTTATTTTNSSLCPSGGGGGAQPATAASSFHDITTGGDAGEEMSSPSRCDQGAAAAARCLSPAPQLPAAPGPEPEVEPPQAQAQAPRKRTADAKPAPDVSPSRPSKQQRALAPAAVGLPPLDCVDLSKPASLPASMPAEYVYIGEYSAMVRTIHDFIIVP